MKKGPYIGIAGITLLSQVISCNNAFKDGLAIINRERVTKQLKFMVGILVSSKTLTGGQNKWTELYPKVSDIPEIISHRDDSLLYTIHYNTDDRDNLVGQIDKIMNISPAIDAIQLNVRWVSHVSLQKIKRKYPELRIILQVGEGAISDVEESDDIFLGPALQAYDGIADDFLIDPSGGNKKQLDVWHAFACIQDRDIPTKMNPGVAGGFYSGNVQKTSGLMRRLTRVVNIDAQGGLRTSTPGGGSLILEEAHSYLKKGSDVQSAWIL